MKQHYHARDRTVLKNSRDGLTTENLHTQEAVLVSKREKEQVFNTSVEKTYVSGKENGFVSEDTSAKKIKVGKRFSSYDNRGNVTEQREVKGENFAENTPRENVDTSAIELSYYGDDTDSYIESDESFSTISDSKDTYEDNSERSKHYNNTGKYANKIYEDEFDDPHEIADRDNDYFFDGKNESATNKFRESSLRQDAFISDDEIDGVSESKIPYNRMNFDSHLDYETNAAGILSDMKEQDFSPHRIGEKEDVIVERKPDDVHADSEFTNVSHNKDSFDNTDIRYCSQRKRRESNPFRKKDKKRQKAHADKLIFPGEKDFVGSCMEKETVSSSYITGKSASFLSDSHDDMNMSTSDSDDITQEIVSDGMVTVQSASSRMSQLRESNLAFDERSGRLRFGHIFDKLDQVPEQTAVSLQKTFQKKRYQRQYHNPRLSSLVTGQPIISGNASGSSISHIKDSSGISIGNIVGFVFGEKKTGIIVSIVLFILTIVLVAASFSGCVAMMGGMASVLSTTYPSRDEDIKGVDEAYSSLEKKLDDQINNVESTHPDFDEYRYQVDEITHNPFQLASLLTAKHGNYTLAEVESELQTILNLQYTLSVTEEVEKRTRTVTDPDTGEETEEEYDYYILNISLTNHGLDYAAQQYLTEDEYKLYQAYYATKGNRKDLFDAEGITISPGGGATGVEYDIPPEALSDERFKRMITEAEKYLGYPYVWGGSSPSTSFDCSGFVSWVVNNSGNGWSYGRQTAEGLRRLCTPVKSEDAKPGDLIFFQGTYNTSGASHVGIYVGNGMMIHCGKPIQYASINTAYWQQHFYMFGRLQ